MDAPAASDKELRMSYRIRRGEQGVLTFEPYKSALLPMWRFKNVQLAQKSSTELWEMFLWYGEEKDFVGMDMARKFIQMVRELPCHSTQLDHFFFHIRDMNNTKPHPKSSHSSCCS